MDCNKDEAIRAKEIAEKKMEKNDFEGARKIALKAQNLYPNLENISQMLSICDVHCSAQKMMLGSEKDWYGILQVEKLADESTIKKQYRRLALILHPDKNRFPGAEGAFKLICEANALLSNPEKKSAYDSKIRVLTRSAPGNPPNHHINRSSQLNKQYSAQNMSNGFSRLNQHQSTQSTSSIRQEVFWTCCPFCKVRYQYLRQYVNKSLHCPTCSKVFMAYEVTQGVSLGSKLGQQGVQHVPSKPGTSQPAVFQEKVVPDRANFKMGVQNARGPSASDAGSQGITSRKTAQPEPCVPTTCGSEGIKVASAAASSKTKETDNLNASSFHGEEDGIKSNTDAICKETRPVRSRKRGRKLVVESSESSDTLSDTDMEDVTKEGPATDLKSESSQAHFTRRSSRKRQHVSYKETDEDDHGKPLKRVQTTKEDNGKEQKDAVDCQDPKHGDENSFPTTADYSMSRNKETAARSKESLKDNDANPDQEGKMRGVAGVKSEAGGDTVEIESDSDQEMPSTKNSDAGLCLCPDPEFSDFDKVRDESQFDVNQFWACYDTLDGMPRFYAKVKKVRASPFELHITWLEAHPIEAAYEKWVDEELPVGCGSFKLGKMEKTSIRLSFSHQVHCEKGKKRGTLVIYPRQGEVWALFKDWNISWSSNPENNKEFKYEIVEVLSDFVAGVGIKVGYLDKVSGFVSLFQRASQRDTSPFLIGPSELYKFSHRVPCFKMTGTEREGVPKGSFELDPASLPLNPDDLYYPGKGKTECRDMDTGVNSSVSKYAQDKGKSVVSGSTSAPQKFMDLEGIKGEMSKPRRSSRGLNVTRQNTN